MRGALFKQPPQAQILMKSKNFSAHQIENCPEIILGIETFEKGPFQPELGTIKVWSQIAPFLHQFITFSGFQCFHFHCVLFLVIFFQTPLSKIQDSGLIFYAHRPTSWILFGGVIINLYISCGVLIISSLASTMQKQFF